MNRLLNKSSSTGQFFRYALVGVFSNVTGYILYLLVTWLGVSPKIAMTALYSIGAIIGFIGNRQWTFSHQGGLFSCFTRYWFVHAVGYVMNLLILIIFVDHYDYNHQWVQAVAIIVVACFLFMMFKFFVFSNNIKRV